jgi:hypothetical protein
MTMLDGVHYLHLAIPVITATCLAPFGLEVRPKAAWLQLEQGGDVK